MLLYMAYLYNIADCPIKNKPFNYSLHLYQNV